ncbi:MAG: TM0106 family RecB-like putative nuclease, partial [Ferruginibacter sp.]
MKKENNTLIFSATDLSNYINCKHLSSQNKEAALGNLKKPVYKNRVTEMLQQKGIAFEAAFLNELEAEGKNIVKIDSKDPEARQRTLDGMQAGADVIYQARLELDNWQGWADFLMRVEIPSDMGAWSYEVLDTKLATETKAGTILQIALYSQMIAELQGKVPENMHVKKPDGTVSYRVDEYIAYVRHVKKRFLAAVANSTDTYPEPVNHCDLCNWWEVCNKKRREDDHLGFIAGMGTAQIKEVRCHQVNTLQQMAELPLPIPFVPVKGSAETYNKLREQARLQLQSRVEHRPVYEMLPLIGGEG